MAIDPDLKYFLRFYLGPAAISVCPTIDRSGTVEILKGLVFPQWKRRAIAICGRQLLVYPGKLIFRTILNVVLIFISYFKGNSDGTCATPEIFDLSGFDIVEHSPCYNRLILKIVPSTGGCCGDDDDIVIRAIRHDDKMYNSSRCGDGIIDCDSLSAFNQSSCSINSSRSSAGGGGVDRDKVLFIGFEESWERDLWSNWLIQVCTFFFISRFK